MKKKSKETTIEKKNSMNTKGNSYINFVITISRDRDERVQCHYACRLQKKTSAREWEKSPKKNDGRNCPLLLLLLLLFCFLLQSLIFLTLLTEDRSKQRASI